MLFKFGDRGYVNPTFSYIYRASTSECRASSTTWVAIKNFESIPGTTLAIWPHTISANSSPYINWLIRQAEKCRFSSRRPLASNRSQYFVPNISINPSGKMPTSGSPPESQSMSAEAFHWLRFAFSYKLRISSLWTLST